MFQIVPAILENDRYEIKKNIDIVKNEVQLIQIDVVDGIFADKVTWPYSSDNLNTKNLDLSNDFNNIELHLMVNNPLDFIEKYSLLGARELTVQVESKMVKEALVVAKREFGVKLGISIMMGTNLSVVHDYLDLIDYVQLMCIDKVGRQGSTFNPEVINKIKELSKFYKGLISVDGAVSDKNIKDLFLAGARRFAVGSFIYKNSDPIKAIRSLKNALQNINTIN